MGNCVIAHATHKASQEGTKARGENADPDHSTYVSTLDHSLFGTVELRRLVQDPGVLCAVKTSFLSQMPKRSMESPELEAAWLRQFQHPNIVSMRHYEMFPDRVVIYTDYCRKGDALQYCGNVAASLCKRWVRQIASALAYMHAQSVVHCDVSVENILIDGEDNALLTDFGMARYVAPEGREFRRIFGKSAYIDPDFLRDGVQHSSADVYALGVSALALFAGRHLWPKFSWTSHWCRNIYERRDWSDVNDRLFARPLRADLVGFLKCLICPRRVRSSAAELLQHPFLVSEDAFTEA